MNFRTSLLHKGAFEMARFILLYATLATANAHAGIEFEQRDVRRQISPFEKEVVARFPFKNTGNSSVRITDMQSCCNCTKPSVAKTLFQPGDTGEIVITFEIGDRHGLQRKGVVVTTNDPAQTPVPLFITADIPEVITLSSPLLLWKEGEAPTGKRLAINTLPLAKVRDLTARAGSKALNLAVERMSESRFNVIVTPSASVRNLSETLLVEALLENGAYKRSSVYVRVR